MVTSEKSIYIHFRISYIRRERFPEFPFAVQGRPNDRSDPTSYLYWIVCISGVILLPLALIHAALRPPYAAYIGTIVWLLAVTSY